MHINHANIELIVVCKVGVDLNVIVCWIRVDLNVLDHILRESNNIYCNRITSGIRSAYIRNVLAYLEGSNTGEVVDWILERTDRRIGKRYGLSKRKRSVPDHILVVQPRQQLHFAGDLSSEMLSQRIQCTDHQWGALPGLCQLQGRGD